MNIILHSTPIDRHYQYRFLKDAGAERAVAFQTDVWKSIRSLGERSWPSG